MYKGYNISFWSAARVMVAIKTALKKNEGFSLVRLGGGEIKSLCHDILIPSREINQRYRYNYAGVKLPDEGVRRELIWGIKNADVVGVLPLKRAPELAKIMKHLRFKPRQICSAYINWILHDEGKGLLYSQMKNLGGVFLIGRRAEAALAHARAFGWQVEGWTSLEGFYDYRRALNELRKAKRARLVLVSAGIPAVVLCSKIARSLRRVALDFGHVMDRIADLDFGSHNLMEKKLAWQRRNKA